MLVGEKIGYKWPTSLLTMLAPHGHGKEEGTTAEMGCPKVHVSPFHTRPDQNGLRWG